MFFSFNCFDKIFLEADFCRFFNTQYININEEGIKLIDYTAFLVIVITIVTIISILLPRTHLQRNWAVIWRQATVNSSIYRRAKPSPSKRQSFNLSLHTHYTLSCSLSLNNFSSIKSQSFTHLQYTTVLFLWRINSFTQFSFTQLNTVVQVKTINGCFTINKAIERNDEQR